MVEGPVSSLVPGPLIRMLITAMLKEELLYRGITNDIKGNFKTVYCEMD